jgi:hypothetical protein
LVSSLSRLLEMTERNHYFYLTRGSGAGYRDRSTERRSLRNRAGELRIEAPELLGGVLEIVADGDGHGLIGDVTGGRRCDGDLTDVESKQVITGMKADIGDLVPGGIAATHGGFKFVKCGKGCGLIEDGVKAVVAGHGNFVEEILGSGAVGLVDEAYGGVRRGILRHGKRAEDKNVRLVFAGELAQEAAGDAIRVGAGGASEDTESQHGAGHLLLIN